MSTSMAFGLADARSLLFVPGNRPERFEKATSSGADAVVLDLEDSVPAADKAAARDAIAREWGRVTAHGVPVVVRIEAPDGGAAPDDIACLRALPGLAGVMLPKAETAQALSSVHAALPDVALPLIETAAGHTAVAADAAAGGAAVQLDGRMVDVPLVMQARRTLARGARGHRQP